MRRCKALLVTCLVVGAVPAGPADAMANEHLARARAEFSALELETADRSLAEALRAGDNDPDALAEIYLLAGQIAASLDEPERAVREFKRYLALRPDGELLGVSPKIAQPFATALEHIESGGALVVRHRLAGTPGRRVVVDVASDPMRMVAGVRITDVGGTTVGSATGAKRLAVKIPGTERRQVVARVHDRWGNALVVFGTKTVPIVVEGIAEKRAPEPRSSPSVLSRWYVWLGVSAAAAGAGTYFALEARSAESDLDELNRDSANHTFDEAQEIEDRWRRNSLGANISFGTAAGFGVLATGLLIWSLAADDSAEVAISPTPGGGAAFVRISF